jgi:hypothetical protein
MLRKLEYDWKERKLRLQKIHKRRKGRRNRVKLGIRLLTIASIINGG